MGLNIPSGVTVPPTHGDEICQPGYSYLPVHCMRFAWFECGEWSTNMRASARNSGIASPAPAAIVASPFQKYTLGMRISDDVFYDEPVPAYKLEKNNASHVFPPDGLNLSDVWVVKIVQSDFRMEDRQKRWPAVFSSRLLETSYQNKETASKHQDSTKKWRYDLLFGNFEMHGEEGRNAGMIFDYGRRTTTKREIGDGQLCFSKIAAAAGTSEAAALAPGTTRELPAAADTDPNQSSRDAAINVGATSVTTRSRAKRQIGAGVEKEGPRPKRQRQNIAGETSKGNSKTPVPKFYIPDVIESKEEGKNDATELEAENVELRSKLGRSERKVFLLAETLAKTHESIQPLIYRTSQAAELLRKSVEIAVKQKVNKNDVEELEEMRDFAWENKTVVEGLVKGAEGAIDKVLSVSPNLGKMIFFHNADAKQELAAWLNGIGPGWGTKPAVGGDGEYGDGDGNSAEDSGHGKPAGSATD